MLDILVYLTTNLPWVWGVIAVLTLILGVGLAIRNRLMGRADLTWSGSYRPADQGVPDRYRYAVTMRLLQQGIFRRKVTGVLLEAKPGTVFGDSKTTQEILKPKSKITVRPERADQVFYVEMQEPEKIPFRAVVRLLLGKLVKSALVILALLLVFLLILEGNNLAGNICRGVEACPTWTPTATRRPTSTPTITPTATVTNTPVPTFTAVPTFTPLPPVLTGPSIEEIAPDLSGRPKGEIARELFNRLRSPLRIMLKAELTLQWINAYGVELYAARRIDEANAIWNQVYALDRELSLNSEEGKAADNAVCHLVKGRNPITEGRSFWKVSRVPCP